MADEIRGYDDTSTDSMKDVGVHEVSGNRENYYGLVVVPATSDGVISSTKPFPIGGPTYAGSMKVIGIVGPEDNELKTSNQELESLMTSTLQELKKMNMYLSMLCSEEIKNNDIED